MTHPLDQSVLRGDGYYNWLGLGPMFTQHLSGWSAMMDLHPTKPAEKGRIAVLPEEIGVLGPLASGLSIGPQETSDGAKLDLSSFQEVHPGRVGRFGEGLS